MTILYSFKQRVINANPAALRKLSTIIFMIVLGLLSACSDNAEEAAFRAKLIDKALNDENARAGADFLAVNAKRNDVITTASGLQIEKIVTGTGVTPNLQDKVEVHYEGSLVDGDIFDSSYQRGSASVFPIKEVIAGWREALLAMHIGDHWKIYIPANLAYGAVSPSAKIAANSTLIFDIKLIAIKGTSNE